MGALRPTAYAVPTEQTSPRWCAGFARGCGGAVQNGGPLREGPFAFFGSPHLWPLFNQAVESGRDYFYGDHAFFGRGRFYRCTKNAKQHTGLTGNDDPKRFRSFGIPIKDWRKTGREILLCPNSETFFRLHGLDANKWISDVKTKLRKHTDRPIVLRWKRDARRKPLDVALRTAFAVVTFTSNAAVEGILAGVPAICTEQCAGLSMSTSDLSLIENLPTPEGREQWAARLANNQWTLDEMKRGDLWRAIGE